MARENGCSPARSTRADVAARLARHSPRQAPDSATLRGAAVAMILRPDTDGHLSTLFIERAQFDGDPWSGQMAFPGGRQDPTDPTTEAAARREVHEEVGVHLQEGDCLGSLDDVIGGRLAAIRLAVTPHVYWCDTPGEIRPNYEVASTVWVPLAFLADPANVVPYRFPPDPERRDFPSFAFDRYVIWGLTYRIVANYMAIFGISLPGEPTVTPVE